MYKIRLLPSPLLSLLPLLVLILILLATNPRESLGKQEMSYMTRGSFELDDKETLDQDLHSQSEMDLEAAINYIIIRGDSRETVKGQWKDFNEIKERTQCFQWYAKEYFGGKIKSPIYHIWIYDPRSASDEELAGTTYTPSVLSRFLTGMFQYLGQQPSIGLAEPQKKPPQAIVPVNFSYDDSQGKWLVKFSYKDAQRVAGLNLWIYGRPVAIYNRCYISDRIIVMPTFEHLFKPSQTKTMLEVKNKIGRSALSLQTCMHRVGIIANRDKIFLTEDSFQSVKTLKLPECPFQTKYFKEVDPRNVMLLWYTTLDEKKVICLIMANGHSILIRSYDNTYGTDHASEYQIMSEEVSETFGPVLGMEANSRFCDYGSYLRPGEYFAVWSEDEIRIYGVTDKNNSFVVVRSITKNTLTKLVTSAGNLVINDALFTGSVLTMVIAVTVDNSIHLLLVDDDSVNNRLIASWYDIDTTDRFELIYPNGGILAYYLYNSKMILYYYGTGKQGILALQGKNETSPPLPLLSGNATIVQVIMNCRSEMIVRLSTGTLLYSYLFMTKVQELTETVPDLDDRLLWFDYLGRLIEIYNPGEDGFETKPFDIEPTYLGDLCPYYDFEHGHSEMELFSNLDVSEKVVIWVALTSRLPEPEKLGEEVYDDLKILLTDDSKKFIKFREIRTSSMYDWMIRINKTITFEVADNLKHAKSMVGDRIRVGFNIRGPISDCTCCTTPNNMAGSFVVGCSPNKFITIGNRSRNPDDCPMFSKPGDPYEYTLYGYQIRYLNGSQGSGEHKLTYDFKTLGCPLWAHTAKVFKPQLFLSDKTNPLKMEPINADFVIYSNTYRDFSYSTTAKQAGCDRPAQTWESMVKKSSSHKPEDIWNQMNYESCFVTDESLADRSSVSTQVYQVLNSARSNALTFKALNARGVYIFTATIIDPHFSYCNLSTTFAVLVAGNQQFKDFGTLQVAASIYVGLLMCTFALTYRYYEKYYWNARR